MKVYTNFKLSKGYEHWKAGFDNLGPEMRAVGMKVIYRACEADNENKVHMILEMPSIETAKNLWETLRSNKNVLKRVLLLIVRLSFLWPTNALACRQKTQPIHSECGY